MLVVEVFGELKETDVIESDFDVGCRNGLGTCALASSTTLYLSGLNFE